MIRRDFVKSTESKPPMPTTANARSLVPPQSAKPGGLPTNSVAQAASNNEAGNMSNTNTNGNRMYQSAQPGMPLSQKSLLSFNALNPAMRLDHHDQQQQQQQYSNGTNHVATSSGQTTKVSPSQANTNAGVPYRSTSLSAANADSRRKKEEIFNNKAKKRAVSASALSMDE